jgi:hypothetical protein
MPDYVIEIHKAWASYDMERSWSNTYEIMAGGAGPADVDNIALALVAAERKLHLVAVNFLEYRIATWEPDSHPYDPTKFVTHSLGTAAGQRGVVGDVVNALDYNVCLMVHRSAASGRSGRLYYRGCLTEYDVKQAGDGRFGLDPTSTFLSAGAGDPWPLYSGLMAPILNDPPTIGGTLALISKSGATIYRRPVTSLEIGGVTINKHNHRYFDKGHITI